MTKRATWIVGMRPKGSRALAGSAVPGAAFIVSSKAASASAAPVRTGAAMKIWDWPAMADLAREFECEIEQLRLVPEDVAEMEIGRDQADFVVDARGEDRGFGIVEYDRTSWCFI